MRTETHLSTVELNFRLNEPFPETTMDGRTVQTTATRHANTLILNQIGKVYDAFCEALVIICRVKKC